ncbi:hypothetical protein ALQ66_102837 [Pseudomonas savastanoi pv. glycinea]|nr:hypothetical protein ALQ66_102837 [Pseudomonas savastanoi pv. glycinea]
MPIRAIRTRICSTVAREREGRSGSFMEDLTQDVRHVRKKCDPRQWETIFQSKWVSRVDRFSKKFPVGKSHSIYTPDSRPVCRLSLEGVIRSPLFFFGAHLPLLGSYHARLLSLFCALSK